VAIRRALFYVSILAFLGYGALLIWRTSFAVGGSDSSGYANTARMIVAGRLIQPVEALERLDLPDRLGRVFMPLAHEPGPRPRTMVPFYPPGYPLHLAAAGILGGWEFAPHFVSPLAALLLVVATYFLARELSLSRLLALVSAAIFAGCAVLLFLAVQAMSDVVSALWATAAVLFALRSRKRDAWAAAAGAAFGMAVLVRPTNALLALPLALALAWRPKTLVFFAAGGLPFAAIQLRWNAVIYGGPLRTGYSTIVGGAFAWSNFPERFVHYARTVAQLFSPLVPLAWLAVGADRRVPRRDRALLLLWVAAYLLLYCFWGPYEAWWYTRFLLPAFPALVVAAVLVGRDLLRLLPEVSTGPLRSSHLALAAAAVLLVTVANAEYRRIRQWKPLGIAEGEQIYPLCMDLVRSKVPERSLIVSMQMSGALRYYTDFQPVRWDWLAPGDFAIVREKAQKRGYRLYALLAPFEEQALTDAAPPRPGLPGKWKFVAQVRDVKLWELE
jgi:hypothetical protein